MLDDCCRGALHQALSAQISPAQSFALSDTAAIRRVHLNGVNWTVEMDTPFHRKKRSRADDER